MFTIVTYKGPHSESCCFDKPSMDHPNLTSSFISIAIEHLVKADWGVKVDMLRASIKNSFSYTIPYAKAWNAKQKAISKLFGDWETSYQYLTRYLEALKKVNPGTEYLFENTPTNDPNIEQFNRVFWAFGPSIRGFKHCRPVITIDGTHLYGKYKGVLLIAMGVDANGQIFPLAFAIVYQEDYQEEIARNLIAKEIFWTKLVSDPLSENVSLAGNYEVEIFNRYEGKCQVITNFGPCWVDLELRTCTCSKWQNLHYPCSHLVAVCQKLNIPFANYIDPGYSTVEYFNSYKLNFFPVLDENLWKQPMGITLVPDPSRKRGFGRPKSKRLLNEMDEGSKSKVKCSLCGGVGHNKRTCSLRPSG